MSSPQRKLPVVTIKILILKKNPLHTLIVSMHVLYKIEYSELVYRLVLRSMFMKMSIFGVKMERMHSKKHSNWSLTTTSPKISSS